MSNIAQTISSRIFNRGTGAGGCNTNGNGKAFEQKCNMEPILLEMGFTKYVTDSKTKLGYYLSKNIDDVTKIQYMKQSGLKKFIKMYNTECEHVDELNHPDECFIVSDMSKSFFQKPTLVVMEMKHQNVEGSCFDKLYNGLYYKLLYNKLIGTFYNIEYHFVVSEFIENKIQKKPHFEEILKENNIKIFTADNYTESILPYLLSIMKK